ncbi:Thoeris anti-defense Tad2 family protein [Xenorhabdus kozodoii]|uniref:Uncharacterized protein n=1 Tax=Xenorhabdus kozodoii TaxID=351676 RepID=A0A2D0LGX1_9GAMM|nr:MW1434 family type I TA system toxin [Xenorhabdus kozodoii]PHM74902.1 hypothetical protein Xkoz_00433 [Xenorhabdus kozodoii]
MSDVSKPESHNADLKCPFNPEDYKVKINDTVAPVGSYPWAIIQVYLGAKIRRSHWAVPDEYLRLAGMPDDLPYIEKRKKDDVTRWQPTQEEMFACDWSLWKPESCMLSFDLELGTSNFSGTGQDWGYLAKDGYVKTDESTFGTLTNLQSHVGIANISMFYFETDNVVYLGVSSAQDNPQQVQELLKKTLYVTVDNTTYHLGTSRTFTYNDNNICYYYYDNDTQKLGAILQETGKTKHFRFTWK